MECRLYGREFDSERGLHVHQSEAHDEVRKEIRQFLDDSAENIIENFGETDFDKEELLKAEEELAGRKEILEFLRTEEFSVDDLEDKIEVIDEIEETLEESLKVQNKRKELTKKVQELRKKEEKIEKKVESDKELRKDEQKELEELKEKKEALEEDTNNLKEEIRELKQEKEDISEEVSKFKEKKEQMREKINRLYDRISDLGSGPVDV